MSGGDRSQIPSSSTPAALQVTATDTGQILPVGGGYRLVERLGRGAFGEVWKAEAPGGVNVAVKIISRTIKGDEAQRELEALELIKQLRHHNLLALQAFFPLEDKLLIILELADGSLRNRLEACREAGQSGIPPLELVRYLREAAEALDYLHEHGVHHRDIKPDNVLLLGSHVKVADFGLARMLEERSLQSATSIGTPAYMAPEIWGGKLSIHSDQYSLATMYAELRLGRFPFPCETLPQLMKAHLEDPPDLSRLGKNEQKALHQALAKDPGQRFASCTAMVQALVKAMMSDGSSSKQARTAAPPKPVLASGAKAHKLIVPQREAGASIFNEIKTAVETGTSQRTEPLPPKVKRGKARSQRKRARQIWFAVGGLTVCLLAGLIAVIAWKWSRPKTEGDPPGDKGMLVERSPADKGASAPLTVDLGNDVKIDFVQIAAGEFEMGSNQTLDSSADQDEQPRHKVNIRSPLLIAATKTTLAQFEKVVGRKPATVAEENNESQEPSGEDKEKAAKRRLARLPAEKVTWFDAIEFCNKLSEKENRRPCYRLWRIQRDDNGSIVMGEVDLMAEGTGYRLPTEAEWEYCARAGKTTRYVFGDDEEQLGAHAWFKDNSDEKTHPVAGKKPNPWGLFDMGGLAWEWCEDVYHANYEEAPADGSAWRSGGELNQRVVRGGSWGEEAKMCRCAHRNSLQVAKGDEEAGLAGFRVLLAGQGEKGK